MFATLNGKLDGIFKKLKGEIRIDEENVKDAVKQVKMALLEADVNYKVVKELISNVERKSYGESVLRSLTPSQVFIKIVSDELIEILGGKDAVFKLSLSSKPPTVILLAGLQGSGKTTTCGKLARYFEKQGRSSLLVSCDVYRPGAIKQLEIVAEKVGAASFCDYSSGDPVDIATRGLEYGKKAAKDVVIIDTAGRLHIDGDMMDEISNIKSEISADYVYFVADAMSGQDAVNVSKEFNESLDIDGVFLTKVDGDALGGAALSIKYVTGKPIKFLGVGEGVDDFEPFHPERMVTRLFGMGDVVSLVEKVQESVAEEEMNDLSQKMMKGRMDFEDLLSQFRLLQKMGSFDSILGMIPGLGGAKQLGASVDEGRIKRMEALILSMTLAERRNVGLLNGSRRRRIALGSGNTVNDVNRLVNQLGQMNKMSKKMSKKTKGFNKLDKNSIKEIQKFFPG